MPWRRKWQPAPVFLPGKSHGQRGLAGYSPRGLKESDMDLATEQQQIIVMQIVWYRVQGHEHNKRLTLCAKRNLKELMS